MPRLIVTEEEAQLVADHRRKHEVRNANEKVIDWIHDWVVANATLAITTVAKEQFAADMVQAARDVFILQPKKKA